MEAVDDDDKDVNTANGLGDRDMDWSSAQERDGDMLMNDHGQIDSAVDSIIST